MVNIDLLQNRVIALAKYRFSNKVEPQKIVSARPSYGQASVCGFAGVDGVLPLRRRVTSGRFAQAKAGVVFVSIVYARQAANYSIVPSAHSNDIATGLQRRT